MPVALAEALVVRFASVIVPARMFTTPPLNSMLPELTAVVLPLFPSPPRLMVARPVPVWLAIFKPPPALFKN